MKQTINKFTLNLPTYRVDQKFTLPNKLQMKLKSLVTVHKSI